jgi:hypothetical protein
MSLRSGPTATRRPTTTTAAIPSRAHTIRRLHARIRRRKLIQRPAAAIQLRHTLTLHLAVAIAVVEVAIVVAAPVAVAEAAVAAAVAVVEAEARTVAEVLSLTAAAGTK